MARYGDLTRKDVRWLLAQRMGDHLDGTTTLGGNLSTLFDNNRLEGSLGLDFRPGNYVYFPTGVLGGVERRITAYTYGSLMSFAPNAATAVPSGIIYEIHNYSVSTYNNAIRAAEARSRAGSWVDELVETTWTTDAFEVSLGGFPLDSLYDVQFYNTYATRWYSLPGPYRNPKRPSWRLLPGTNPKLQFQPNYFTQPASGATIRIYGQRHPLLMTLDSDTCENVEEWILDLAEMELHLSRDTGSRDAQQRTARAGNAWNRVLQSAVPQLPAKPGSIPIR